MRVLVTGSTGFVGGNVCSRLMVDGWEVRGLSRGAGAGRPDGVTAAGVIGLHGDVVSGDGLGAAMDGVDAVVHLVGIIHENHDTTFEQVHVAGTRNVVAAAREAGAARLVHMSALGAGSGSGSRYHASKAAAEEVVRSSGLDWTIMRPSLIFGVGDDFFGGTLRRLVTMPPVVPVVGRGDFPFRPVWVEDVATAFARALQRPAATRQTFELVGPHEYTLRELLLLVRDQLRPRKPLIGVPLPLMRLGTLLFRLLPNPPITADQLLMLLAGNTGDPRPAVEALGLELAELEQHLPAVLAAITPTAERNTKVI